MQKLNICDGEIIEKFRNKKKVWWLDGWIGGWEGAKSVLRITYSSKKRKRNKERTSKQTQLTTERLRGFSKKLPSAINSLTFIKREEQKLQIINKMNDNNIHWFTIHAQMNV